MILGSAITVLAYAVSKSIGKLRSRSDNRTDYDDNNNDGTSLKRSERNIKEVEPETRGTDYSDANTQRMYKDLGMTANQRRQYETDYRKVMDEWEKKNPSINMDNDQKVEQHNKALNAVLDEAQYAMYRDWSRDNPNDY